MEGKDKKNDNYTKDDIEQVFNQQKKNGFITSVIVKQDACYFFI